MEPSTPIDAEQPEPGGKGGGFDPVKDRRLAERALAESWPIPAAIRGRLIESLTLRALSKASSPREATAAARVILAASKQNLDAIGVTMQAEQHEDHEQRLAEIERRLDEHRGEAPEG
jgi:hypothetical protein